MIVSTRGRYALRVMIDIAENQQETGYIALKEIAQRQQISQKYIESIMTILSKANFVDAVHGKGGGYRLNRQPSQYKVREILEVTEGTLAPVACLECNSEPCEKESECRTLSLWKGLYEKVTDYLESVSIEDLMKKSL